MGVQHKILDGFGSTYLRVCLYTCVLYNHIVIWRISFWLFYHFRHQTLTPASLPPTAQSYRGQRVSWVTAMWSQPLAACGSGQPADSYGLPFATARKHLAQQILSMVHVRSYPLFLGTNVGTIPVSLESGLNILSLNCNYLTVLPVFCAELLH